jgi:hypothetical protein
MTLTLTRTPPIPYRSIFHGYLIDCGEPLDRESRHAILKDLPYGEGLLSRASRLEHLAAAVLTAWLEHPQAQILPASTRDALDRASILARPFDDGDAHLVIFTHNRKVLYHDTWRTTGSLHYWRAFIQCLWGAFTDQLLKAASSSLN